MAVLLESGCILRSFPSETPSLQLGTERLDLGHGKPRSVGVLKGVRGWWEEHTAPYAASPGPLGCVVPALVWRRAAVLRGTDKGLLSGFRMARPTTWVSTGPERESQGCELLSQYLSSMKGMG